MGQLIIVLGDRTDHGGTVITAGATTETNGFSWARMGDMVACPKCKGVFPIVQGDANFISDGAPIAYSGCKESRRQFLVAAPRRVVPVMNPIGLASSAAQLPPRTKMSP